MVVLGTLFPFTFQCYLLIDLADASKCEWDLTCNPADKQCSCSCEAETNKLKCKIVKFFKDIKLDGVNVKQLIFDLLNVCDEIYALARAFNCANKPSCNKDSDVIPCSAIKDFEKDFGDLLAKAEAILAAINTICKSVTSGNDDILASVSS